MSTPPQLHVARKPADQTQSRDPKAGVAHRPDGRNYVRHKLGLTVEEWEALDRVGAYLFPKLKSAGQRPSRGMIVGELLKRL